MITPVEIMQKALRAFTTHPVVIEVPTRRPDVFIRVQTTEPKPINLVQHQTLIFIQVYGNELEQVIELSAQIERYLFNVEMNFNEIDGWNQTTSPSEHTDPDIPTMYRWQQSGEFLTARSW